MIDKDIIEGGKLFADAKIKINPLSKDDFYEIACIIDNEFRGSQKQFSACRLINRFHLTTNQCDWASLINVYHNGIHITSIQQIADDTDSWQEIHPSTVNRIIQWYNPQKQ